MFVEPLDAILTFMITTPVVGWIAYKRGYRKIQGIYAAAGLAVSTYLLYGLYQKVSVEGPLLYGLTSSLLPLEAHLKVDMLSIFMVIVYLSIGLLATVYSIKYLEKDTGRTLFYTLLLGMIGGMMGVVFAGDFLTLYVFWELMCLTSYALVAFRKERPEPIEAGFKYLIMSAAGSATILLSMSFLYGMAGSLNFAVLAERLGAAAATPWLYVAVSLVMVGFGVKAAIVPFHTWLPDAQQEAPAPISALLAGAVDQTAVYALIRILPIFDSVQITWQTTLVAFAVLTMFVGNIMALLQDNIKRLLAFSTISQTGYILFGLAIVSPQGLTGSLFHILNHAICKTLLFLCAGIFAYKVGTCDLKKLAGIRRSMPVTGIILAIGAVSTAGIPPTNAFWSKWMLIAAGIDAGMFMASTLMLVNLFLSAPYYLRLIHTLALKEPTSLSKKASEAPASMLAPIIFLAALCILIGVYPDPFISISSWAAEAILGV